MSKGEVIVLGCGLIGTSIAIDFLGSSSVSSVTVVDVSNERLSSLQQRASKFSGIDPVSGSNANPTEKLHTVELDVIRHREELLELLEKADYGIGAFHMELRKNLCRPPWKPASILLT